MHRRIIPAAAVLLAMLCSCGGEKAESAVSERVAAVGTEESIFLPREYYKLEENERLLYLDITRGAENFDELISVTASNDKDSLLKVYTMIIRLDPRLLLLDEKYRYTEDENGNITSIRPRYLVDTDYGRQMRERLALTADTVLSGLSDDMSGLERALYIHDSVAILCSYTDGFMADSVYGALVRGECRCQGYSKGFAYLCCAAGIPAGVTDGSADGAEHMWSYFVIDGETLYTDVTRDDMGERIGRGYFALTEEEISSMGYHEQGLDEQDG